MKKLGLKQFQGTEYIQLSSMPFDQMVLFKEWLAETDIFSLKIQNEVLNNCVNYEDYEFWFDHIKSERPAAELALF